MLSAEEINIAKLKKYKKPPVNLLKRPEGGVKANKSPSYREGAEIRRNFKKLPCRCESDAGDSGTYCHQI